LAKEGAQRFTTARVAERAGVSVGSVYQYFPNNAAILFRLQTDEWRISSGCLVPSTHMPLLIAQAKLGDSAALSRIIASTMAANP